MCNFITVTSSNENKMPKNFKDFFFFLNCALCDLMISTPPAENHIIMEAKFPVCTLFLHAQKCHWRWRQSTYLSQHNRIILSNSFPNGDNTLLIRTLCLLTSNERKKMKRRCVYTLHFEWKPNYVMTLQYLYIMLLPILTLLIFCLRKW